MIVLLLFLIILATISLKWTRHKQKYMKYIGHLPSPKEYPFIGSAYRLFAKSTKDIMNVFIEFTETLPTPSRLWFGPTLVIIIGEAEDMQIVLNSPHCLEKTYVYKFFDNNVGLFTAPVFNQKAEVLSKNLNIIFNKSETFDISKNLFVCTLDMVCGTTLGIDLEYQTNKNKELLEALEKASEIIAKRIAKLWLHADCIYKLTSDYRKRVKMDDIIYEFSAKVRTAKQKEFEKAKLSSTLSGSDDEFFSTPQIFVNELLKMHERGLINDQTLDDHILTMIVAGHETTALTTSHVVLRRHEDLQEKVFHEIKDAHLSQTSHTDYDTLAKLNYLEMFIKETMRHFPIGPILGREALEDTPIRNCVIPKGSIIMLSFHNLHKDKNVWGSDAQKFNPDHFLPKKIAQRHPYQYLPFSGGARNCIGIKYAWMSMKILISLLVRRYKFTTDLKFDDLETKWDVTLKLVNEHMVRIERRTY